MQIDCIYHINNASQYSPEVLRNSLLQARRVVLVAHTNADGDAVGSVLGMYHLLRTLTQASIQPMLPDGCPDDMRWLPGADSILSATTHGEACRKAIAEADLIVALDVNSFSRTGSLQQLLADASATKILIDHHENPNMKEFDTVVSDAEASSACELTYWTMRTLFGQEAFCNEAATCLFTGICTDTGTFAYSNNHPSVYLAAAELLSFGIDPMDITRRIRNVFTPQRMMFFGYAISHLMTVYPEQRIALLVISQADMQRHAVESHELTGLINEVMRLRDTDCGILIREEDGKVRLSLRSKTIYDVNQVAGELFGGGGHVRAAGATSQLSLEATVDKVKQYFGL